MVLVGNHLVAMVFILTLWLFLSGCMGGAIFHTTLRVWTHNVGDYRRFPMQLALVHYVGASCSGFGR